MDGIDLFFFLCAAISAVIYQIWFFKSSVENFEDKKKWGALSEEDDYLEQDNED